MARTSATVPMLAGLLGTAIALSACRAQPSRHSATTRTQAPGIASATASALSPSRQFAVLVGASSVQPAKLTLPMNAAVRLEITNNGPACEFSAGDYLRGLSVLQGETVEAVFVVGSVPADISPSPSPSTIGCAGDTRRQAQFAVAQTASNPSGVESRASDATPAAGVREIGFDLQSDSMRPHEVDLPYNARAHLTVVNRGAACLFTFGDYLRGLLVPAGGNAAVTLTVANRFTGSATPSPNPAIGCLGDSQRQGLLALAGTPPARGTPAQTPTSPAATPAR